MAARSAWSGAISFGGFPIHLSAYNVVKSKSAESLKTLCPCHQEPIVAPKVCATTGDPVNAEDALKGVQVARGDIRLLDANAVEALTEGERSEMLDILSLPELDTVPLHMGVGHYRLVPNDKVPGSAQPAEILWNGLRESGRALVTEWVKRAGSRNELLTIHADVYGLNGTVLPYKTDLNDVPEHKFEENAEAGAMFEAFASQQGIDTGAFSLDAYVDRYRERRDEMIAAALSGKPIEVTPAAAAAPAVPDLMAAMQASLNAVKAPAKKKPAARKAPAKAAKS